MGTNELLPSFRRCRMAGFLNAKGSTERDKLQKWDQYETGEEETQQGWVGQVDELRNLNWRRLWKSPGTAGADIRKGSKTGRETQEAESAFQMLPVLVAGS